MFARVVVVVLIGAAGCDAVPTLVGPGAGEENPDEVRDTDASPADAAPPVPDAAIPPGAVVVPSNPDVGPLLETGLVLAPPDGTFDTDADCKEGAVLGNCTPTNQGAYELCVCRMDELTVGDLRVVGARGLVLLAWTSVVVKGTLDVGAHRDVDGPGVGYYYPHKATQLTGGAGGSGATFGGNPGAAQIIGEETLVPLIGGMRGQGGCNSAGGGGGGALQITAGRTLVVSGAIRGSGGGGQGGAGNGNCLGGSGGGSGGVVLLEAPLLTVSGTIAANGGAGGGGASDDYGAGGYGADGAVSMSPAQGGGGNEGYGCPLQGYTAGGWGGWGSPANLQYRNGGPADGISGCLSIGSTYLGAGGGGGGIGRVRLNTSFSCDCPGTFSPPPSMGAVRFALP